MNRAGEIKRAMRWARMDAAVAAWLNIQLDRHCDWTTGEVTARYATTMATLAEEAHLGTERTAQRAAAHAARHGWWKPTRDPDAPRKVTGLITLGFDCDCRPLLTCQICGRPLPARSRSDARTCSDRCRKTASRTRPRQGP